MAHVASKSARVGAWWNAWWTAVNFTKLHEGCMLERILRKPPQLCMYSFDHEIWGWLYPTEPMVIWGCSTSFWIYSLYMMEWLDIVVFMVFITSWSWWMVFFHGQLGTLWLLRCLLWVFSETPSSFNGHFPHDPAKIETLKFSGSLSSGEPPIFSKKNSLQASPRRSTSSAEGRDVDHTWPSIVSRHQPQWGKPDWRIGWKMSGFEVIVPLPKSVWVWQCFSSSFSTVNVHPNWHKSMFDKKEFICSHLCDGTNGHHRIKTKASSWELLQKIRFQSCPFSVSQCRDHVIILCART